jgi:hypothetical protein
VCERVANPSRHASPHNSARAIHVVSVMWDEHAAVHTYLTPGGDVRGAVPMVHVKINDRDPRDV